MSNGNFSNDPEADLRKSIDSGHIGVLIEQGVPLLDRDINLLGNLPTELMRRALRMFVGSGFPLKADAFNVELAKDGLSLKVSAGQCLLDGLVLDNKATIIAYNPYAEGEEIQLDLVYVFPKFETADVPPQSDVQLRTSLFRVATPVLKICPLNWADCARIQDVGAPDVRRVSLVHGAGFEYSPSPTATLSSVPPNERPYLPLALIVRVPGSSATVFDVRQSFNLADVQQRLSTIEQLVTNLGNVQPSIADRVKALETRFGSTLQEYKSILVKVTGERRDLPPVDTLPDAISVLCCEVGKKNWYGSGRLHSGLDVHFIGDHYGNGSPYGSGSMPVSSTAIEHLSYPPYESFVINSTGKAVVALIRFYKASNVALKIDKHVLE